VTPGGARDHWIGIGLRAPHVTDFLGAEIVPVDFVEVHAENYFEPGGARHALLRAVAQRHPVSVHGVALSLGSADGIDDDHLDRLATLVADISPSLVSEHLAWCRADGIYYNDLLPLPLDEATLDIVSRNIDHAQARLGRTILVENPSGYMTFDETTIREGDFLARLCARTGCGVLLDVNNLYVSGANLGTDIAAWLNDVPAATIGQIHLAGHAPDAAGSGLLIDTHGSAIAPAVWNLFTRIVGQIGPRPTIIEWDSDIPPLDTLFDQARLAREAVTGGIAA